MSTGTLTVAPRVRSLTPRVPRGDAHVERGDCWDLVAAAQQGDTDAYGQLYRRYYETVFRFVLFRVSSRDRAEDLTSETFLRALSRIQTVSYQGRDIGAWFVTIARNLILDDVKSSRYRLEVPTGSILDAAGDQTSPFSMRSVGFTRQLKRTALLISALEADPAQEAIDGIYHAQLRADLNACRARLTGMQRKVLVYRFDLGYTVEQTATAMGINSGAVKALQHRAVRRLAELLPARAHEEARLN